MPDETCDRGVVLRTGKDRGGAMVELPFGDIDLGAPARPGELPEFRSRHVRFEPQLVLRASTAASGRFA